MNNVIRFIKHLSVTRWHVRRIFPKHSLLAITHAIAASEKQHMGELRFAVEAGLVWPELIRGINSRTRALQIFSDLRVWDTENNSGVLIYLLLVDRKLEIIADRGINKLVEQSSWDKISRQMEFHFRNGEFEKGVLQGIEVISALLKQHFPADASKQNELPDRPVIL